MEEVQYRDSVIGCLVHLQRHPTFDPTLAPGLALSIETTLKLSYICHMYINTSAPQELLVWQLRRLMRHRGTAQAGECEFSGKVHVLVQRRLGKTRSKGSRCSSSLLAIHANATGARKAARIPDTFALHARHAMLCVTTVVSVQDLRSPFSPYQTPVTLP